MILAALLGAEPVGAQPFPGGLPRCVANLNTCTAGLTQAQDDLAVCQMELAACQAQQFPATGQTTCWDSSGSVISCAGTGHDGDIRAGAALSYTDTGDGTITDKDALYSWANAFGVKIATLNTTSSCFAGHCDWRLPNVKELQSIANYQNFNPAVSAVFHTDCVANCTVTTCSCTAASFYWSSTSSAAALSNAWLVNSRHGSMGSAAKAVALHVRAVRGGQ